MAHLLTEAIAAWPVHWIFALLAGKEGTAVIDGEVVHLKVGRAELPVCGLQGKAYTVNGVTTYVWKKG